MDNKPNSNAYLKTRVLTASPEQLQLMLYDGAIRFCEQARVAIEAKDIEKSYKLITRAEDIVMELTNGLRDDIDPETCANMRNLYIFCYERLVDANLKKELSCLDDAVKVLRHMRETWVLLIEKLQQERCGGQAKQSLEAAQSAQQSAKQPLVQQSAQQQSAYQQSAHQQQSAQQSAQQPSKQPARQFAQRLTQQQAPELATVGVGGTINFEG